MTYVNPHGFRAALLLAALLGLGACDALKGPELSLATDKDTIAAGGYEYAEITATVLKGGKAFVGAEVTFVTTSGSFSSTEELQEMTVASNAQGLASARLYSADAQGQAAVTATTYDEESGLEATDNLTITFGPPQAGNLPVDGKFHLQCSYLAIGALRNPIPDITVPCSLEAQTVGGDTVPLESLNLHYLAEAGVLEDVVDEWTGDVTVRYQTQGGSNAPVDVHPSSGEPSRTGTLGEEHNPRDGVVTLVAITTGSEAFVDLNDDGVRNDNEPFTDLDEPFLDVDDDGIYTPGVDEYYDCDGSGDYSLANGQYDAETCIWAVTKVVWTGVPEFSGDGKVSRWELTGSEHIPNGGSATLTVYLLDKHMNPVAAFLDNGDHISFTDANGYVLIDPTEEIPLSNKVGMTFDDDGSILLFDPNQGRVQVTIRDYDSATVNDPALDWAVSIQFFVTPGTDAEESYLTQEQGYFTPSPTGDVL